MAELKNWPWIINQPGYDYPAELVRAQHFDATSGGNGVGSPAAMRVEAQPAPDGTVSILPGGATARSNYPGAEGQSYHVMNFQPFTLTVPPTGSASGGRHDLIILRVCDPQYDTHPEHGGGEISAEEAANYDFWWFELLQGKNQNTSLPYPHVKLAEIIRPANTTIVTSSHIRDLRELAAPKTWLHLRARNLWSTEEQSLHSTTSVWPEDATHTMRVPEWATRVHMWGMWATVKANTANASRGYVVIALIHPDGSEVRTQNARWQNVRDGDSSRLETINIMNGDNQFLPEKFRGQEVRVEMRGTKDAGPNVYMDGNSSWSVQLYFEQEIT